MKISELMTRDVQIVAPDDTIERAAQFMGRIDAGVLPVGEGERLVGMITDRDIAIRAVAEGRGPDASVGDVMSREVKHCHDDAEVDEVLRNMGEIQVRRLPVVDSDKRLVGIVSIGDLDRQAPQETAEAMQAITRQSELHSQTV